MRKDHHDPTHLHRAKPGPRMRLSWWCWALCGIVMAAETAAVLAVLDPLL